MPSLQLVWAHNVCSVLLLERRQKNSLKNGIGVASRLFFFKTEEQTKNLFCIFKCHIRREKITALNCMVLHTQITIFHHNVAQQRNEWLTIRLLDLCYSLFSRTGRDVNSIFKFILVELFLIVAKVPVTEIFLRFNTILVK